MNYADVKLPRFTGQLAPEHIAYAEQVQADLMAAALSTEPADRAESEAALATVYQTAGLEVPPIVWMDSPLGGLFAYGVLTQITKRDQLWDQLGGQLWGQLGREVSVWWDSYWFGICTVGLPAAELGWSERLESVMSLSRSCGWWWPYKGIAILTDRPSTLQRDVQGRLHREDGPALEYRDSYAMHSWHGVRVPEWVTGSDGGPTVEKIMAEENAEVRRCGIESFGWDRFIPAAGLRLLDEQPDPANGPYTVALYDLPDRFQDPNDPCRVILVTNASDERDGTRRRFGLLVDRHHTDAVEAAASTFNKSKAEYLQLESAS